MIKLFSMRVSMAHVIMCGKGKMLYCMRPPRSTRGCGSPNRTSRRRTRMQQRRAAPRSIAYLQVRAIQCLSAPQQPLLPSLSLDLCPLPPVGELRLQKGKLGLATFFFLRPVCGSSHHCVRCMRQCTGCVLTCTDSMCDCVHDCACICVHLTQCAQPSAPTVCCPLMCPPLPCAPTQTWLSSTFRQTSRLISQV